MEHRTMLLKSIDGQRVAVTTHDLYDLHALLSADGLILEGSYGFNILGGFIRQIATALRIPEIELRETCDWNTYESDSLCLVHVNATEGLSKLKSAVFVPTQLGRVYPRYATPHHGKPYRDFYYTVVFESLRCLSKATGEMRSVAIGNLTGSAFHHPDIVACAIEAIFDHCSETQHSLEQVALVGYFGDEVMEAIEIVSKDVGRKHRAARVETESISERSQLITISEWTRKLPA